MFTTQNMSSDSATSGKQALNLIQNRLELVYAGKASMYKVIMLDFSMPEMDGPQVAIEIRRMLNKSILTTSSKSPFICCCTAYAEASFRGKAIDSGMDHFLTKPFEYEDLDMILTHLN